MIVNTNIRAINTHRQLSSMGSSYQKTSERLSTGRRINRGSDDAAGLAISEGMRNQIRGLDQSIRNAQDGISLIQTTEGALEEVHRLLERMRVLTNQAANDTYDHSDRSMINKEIEELTAEITRISQDTEFNGIKVFSEDMQSALKMRTFAVIKLDQWIMRTFTVLNKFPLI